MSFRGGRGGFGGRGGLKGATWEQDEGLEAEARKIRQNKGAKIGLFPEHPTGANVKKPKPLTAREKCQIRHLKTLQEQIHRGPLYSQPTKRNVDNPIKIFGEDQFNAQYGSDKKATMDPFTEGVETYSDRYAPPKNLVPKLSGRPFNNRLFPEELWSTLNGEEDNVKRQKTLTLNGSRTRQKLKDPASKKADILARIDALTAGDDDLEELDEDEQEEEPMDDDFDDDELGDDYNAEQYFDNGDDNDDGDAGGEEDY
ncbi:hypothetical protein LARI1_G002627 [Lachnellula arida]|uniref:DNA-directed RNA polymerase III subunit n=1 Tax=Lachnellula arida TaxID=1316785 RepID=A0A8T9BIR7_9HELO|nr:hypothetical protein LARI1_G002627 [Lachnellula arida]